MTTGARGSGSEPGVGPETGTGHRVGLSFGEVRDLLGLQPLAVEGGWWAQTHLDSVSGAIYYLLGPGDHSRLHRLHAREIYHFHGGAPLELVLVDDGGLRVVTLGMDLRAGQRPQVVVPPGVWQGSVTTGDWSLVGTTMAPPFDPERCEFADRTTLGQLCRRFPHQADLLTRLA